MTTIYTPEEREAKVERCIEIIRGMNHEELVKLNQLIDKLQADYQREQAAEEGIS